MFAFLCLSIASEGDMILLILYDYVTAVGTFYLKVQILHTLSYSKI